MSDATPAILESWREILLGLFPFLARFRTRPISEGGALEIKSVGAKIEMQGGGRPASGKGHAVVRLAYNNPPTTLYYSTDITAPYTWNAVPSAALPGPPLAADAGVLVTIIEGSGKVEIDS